MPFLMASEAETPSGSTAARAAEPTAAPLTVAALLVADRLDDQLVETLLSVADQQRAPDRLRIVDATPAGEIAAALERNTGLRAQLPTTEIDRRPPGSDLRAVVAEALADLDTAAVWVLTRATRPEPAALRELLDALAAGPDVAIAGPKLLDAERPGRLQRFGIQATRSGRLRLAPVPGEPDQQQYDHRRAALAVPIEAALVRREAVTALGAFDPAFAGLGADLDLGWRAHRGGLQVALAPGARVRLTGRPAHPTPGRERRQARRVALTRCPVLAAPLLAAWITLGAVAAALGLLLLKRPRAAGREVGDLGALADPWRLIAARWRARRTSRGARPAAPPFVPGAAVLRSGLDRLPDLLLPAPPRPFELGGAAAVREPGPGAAASGAEPAAAEPAVRNPGGWAVFAALVAALIAGRTLPGGLTAGVTDGFTGGRLTGVTATAGGLWHDWLDGWAGPGLGSARPGSSALPVLAAATWLWQALPFHDAGPNPAGGLIGVALLLAAPAAASSAYLAARVLTRRRWPRALAALVWALSPAAAAALGEGRLGGLALLVLLPPVLAGLAGLTSSPRAGVVAAAALPAALLAAILPGALVLVAILAGTLLLPGSARTARRVAAYLAVTALAAAPVLWEVRADPVRLLTGWGVLDRAGTLLTPREVATLTPQIDAGPWAWSAVPVIALGIVALLRRRPPSGPSWFAGALIVLGVTLAFGAPRIQLSRGPGEAMLAPWSGSGVVLALAGLLVAGIHAIDRPLRPRSNRLAALIATVAALAVAAGFVVTGLGAHLRPARDARPAVAADQARGPAAGRSIVIDISRGEATYAVLGREPAAPAPELDSRSVVIPGIEAAVGSLTGSSGATDAAAVRELATWGVGFVVVRPPVPASVEHRLDATQFLSRIGDYGQAKVWRVEPEAAGTGLTAPGRLLLTSPTGDKVVPVTGQNAATRTTVDAPPGARLVVGQPAGWAEHARVSVDGRRLTPEIADGRPSYALPAGTHELRIALADRFPVPVWAYAALLALLAYAAVPLGSRRPPRRPA